MFKIRILLSGVVFALVANISQAQDYSKYSEEALRKVLNEIAVVETKVLMPMRDGIGLSTDIYRPKDAEGPVPTIFVRTP